MNKALSIAFLVMGVLLIFFGVEAWNSVSSGVSEVVTGAPSSKAIWLLIGGVVLSIVGLVDTLRKSS